MKKIPYSLNKGININNTYSILSFLSNKKFISRNHNCNNNFNYTFNEEISNNINKIKKRISKKKTCKNFLQTAFDIGNSLSNIKKQLNNVSVNEKNVLKISKNKIKYNDSYSKIYNLSTTNKSNKLKDLLNKYKPESKIKNELCKSKQISFSILCSNSEKFELIIKYKDLKNENDLLKENIKFLLSQIKKLKNNELKDSYINELSSKICINNINNNKTKENKNISKIGNVFDILNKYKKEIYSLKQKLKKLNKENEELRNCKENNIIKNYNYKKDLYKKYSIIKNPTFKNNISFKKIIPNSGYNNISAHTLYRKKTLNKIDTSFKFENVNSYCSDNNNYDNNDKCDCISKISEQNYINYNIPSFNINYSNFNSKNNKNFNSFNTKKRHLILIDSDFTGDEKIGTQNSILSCENINNDKIHKDNIFLNEINYINLSNKLKEAKTPSSKLYYRKTVNNNLNSQIPIIKDKIKRKNLLYKSIYDKSSKYINSSKIKFANNILKLNIMKINEKK